MALFQIQTGSIVMVCSNVDLAKQWWMKVFDCKQGAVPQDWDDTLPSDVALDES